jgi:hypothetical protein
MSDPLNDLVTALNTEKELLTRAQAILAGFPEPDPEVSPRSYAARFANAPLRRLVLAARHTEQLRNGLVGRRLPHWGQIPLRLRSAVRSAWRAAFFARQLAHSICSPSRVPPHLGQRCAAICRSRFADTAARRFLPHPSQTTELVFAGRRRPQSWHLPRSR